MADKIDTKNIRELMDRSFDAQMELFDSGYAKDVSSPRFSDAAIARSLSPYNFRMSTSYTTYKQAMADLYRVSDINKNELASIQRYGQIDTKDLLSDRTDDNPFFTRPSVMDTSMGGNEVINSRWAFCRDDDIIQPLQALGGNPALGGLGRVYFERYQVTQQMLDITVGVPEFQELIRFYDECVDGQMSDTVNYGEGANIAKMFGRMVGGAVKLAIALPLFPIRFPGWLAEKLDPKERITKYYELKSAMPMFYRYANTIFVQLGSLMGFVKPFMGDSGSSSWMPEAGTMGQTGGVQANNTINQLMMDSGDQNPASFPLFMQSTGPNIWYILSKRDYRRQGHKIKDMGDLEDYIDAVSREARESGGWFDAYSSMYDRAASAAQGADKFISFRINKSTDSTETMGNSTGQSSIAQKLNSIASSGRDAQFSLGGSISNAVREVPVFGKVLGGIADVVSGTAQQFGLSSLASAVMTGSGFIDIPDIWTSSSFSKNYSFNFTFRPASGNNAAIYQDLYLPLSLLLAMSCPRSVGTNSYTSPFILRAYCKGMFAIPCGIVESLSLTRGDSEFGWNMNRLPTVLKVSMQIKDLAPIMHLAMVMDATNYKVFGANSSMQEYVHTLAGSGLNERLLFSSTFARRMNLAMGLNRSTWLNPDFAATALGNSALPRIMGSISATSLYSN